MLEQLARHWWVVLLRGIVAIIFSIIAFTAPGLSLYALVIVFGAYSLVDGVTTLLAASRFHNHTHRWWALVWHGIIGVLFGIVAFAMTFATLLALLFLVAAWAIVTGVVEIIAAIRLRQVMPNEWLLVLAGVISLALGIALLVHPLAGLHAAAIIIGIYAFLYGVILISLSFRLKGVSPLTPLA